MEYDHHPYRHCGQLPVSAAGLPEAEPLHQLQRVHRGLGCVRYVCAGGQGFASVRDAWISESVSCIALQSGVISAVLLLPVRQHDNPGTPGGASDHCDQATESSSSPIT